MPLLLHAASWGIVTIDRVVREEPWVSSYLQALWPFQPYDFVVCATALAVLPAVIAAAAVFDRVVVRPCEAVVRQLPECLRRRGLVTRCGWGLAVMALCVGALECTNMLKEARRQGYKL